MYDEQQEIQIDIWDLMIYLSKKVKLILAVCLLCSLVGGLVSSFILTPQYTASTRIYVLNRSNTEQVVTSDFQISTYIVNDYQELIRGRNVTKPVIEQLKLSLSDKELSKKIEITSPEDTRILHIEVTDPDPYQAAQIANAVREVATEQLERIIQEDSVSTVYEAEVPEQPSSPDVLKNTIIMGLVGLIAIVAILSLIHIWDDRIRTEEDVERYLGLPTLGVIPAIPEFEQSSNAKKKRG